MLTVIQTKIIPEELVPVKPLGLLKLNRNPRNYFAETEQVMVSDTRIEDVKCCANTLISSSLLILFVVLISVKIPFFKGVSTPIWTLN